VSRLAERIGTDSPSTRGYCRREDLIRCERVTAPAAPPTCCAAWRDRTGAVWSRRGTPSGV